MDPRVLMVDRLRLWVTALLRLAAVVWAGFAFVAVVRWIGILAQAWAAVSHFDGFFDALVRNDGVGLTFTMVGHVVGTAVLVLLSRKLACWIVPAAKGCPACGYNIGGIKSNRCPECGEIISFVSAGRKPE